MGWEMRKPRSLSGQRGEGVGPYPTIGRLPLIMRKARHGGRTWQ